MNETPDQQTEFVFRRLAESLSLGGKEVSPYLWLAILIPVLILGFFYIGWMYRRDSRSIPWPWAAFLGCLRGLVYLLLAGIFLLPAMQTWEKSEKRGRVLMLVDVSPSVGTISDDLPEEGSAPSKPSTRLDKVISFLTDKQANVVGRILATNPVYAYRFGARLDEEPREFTAESPSWDAAQWKYWLTLDLKQWVLEGLSPEGREAVRNLPAFESDKPGSGEWAVTWLKRPLNETIPATLSEADQNRLNANRGKLDKRTESVRQILLGTNVAESLLSLLNRESNSMVQGVVLISDGRSNLGSESTLAEVRSRAKNLRVPIFSIAIGEDRQPINIRITDLQTPEQTPPDEKFVIRAEIDGEGLPDQESKAFLDVYKPEADQPSTTLETTIKFQPGEPPHAQAEFTIDPEQLPADLKSETSARREMIEGDWKFVVRVPKDRREIFLGKEHVSDPATVAVIKKPLRVLLVASGPMKDYQFLRTLMVREKDAKRAEVSIFLQNEGRDGRAMQDVEPERMLNRFPTTLRVEDDPNEKVEDKYYNLAQYDLIVMFDPDWNEFTAEQIGLLQKWVDSQAGGLVVVAGPVNTFQLARDDGSGRLKPLLDLLPVVPGDSVLLTGPVRRQSNKPWRLNFAGANPDMEFLKLDDDSMEPLAGWKSFFDGGDKAGTGSPKRGFFNYYPIKSVKPGATVVATFTDPLAQLDGKEHPFLVTQQFGKGRVMFVGSGELWRLRSFKEVFFERFWMKLGRYASAGNRTRQNRRGVLVMGRQFTAGQYVRVEAQLFGPSLEPLPRSLKPKAVIQPSEGGEKREIELTPKAGQGDWSGWFQGRLLLTKAGDYKLDLPIPSSSDVLRGKFIVKDANPELDNTRPDHGALALMAGDLEEVAPRLTSKTSLEDLRARLRASRAADAKSESPKLVFTLASAEAIPNCLPAVPPQISRNRGPVDDLWDDGPTLGTASDGKPISVATALLVAVGLLGLEWLIRKLLRLA